MPFFFLIFLLVLIDLIIYLRNDKRHFPVFFSISADIIYVVLFPLFFFYLESLDQENNCCNNSILNSDYLLPLQVLITICVISYFYSGWRKSIAGPITELFLNLFLYIGIIINIVFIFHFFEIAILICPTIILLYLMRIVENQMMIMSDIKKIEYKNGSIMHFLLKILTIKTIYKVPVLLILCLPVLFLISIIFILFGQSPDAIIRAFTETYHHGFSTLDYQCENVKCGEHYLCSVAANGHKKIVKPYRIGYRNGGKIICNRQLLVSNAFEELLMEKWPWIHGKIRKKYNNVGNMIHRYYKVFNIKIVSDIIYIAMKPIEWFFLLVLYTFDKNPENRIAKQYLKPEDRKAIS